MALADASGNLKYIGLIIGTYEELRKFRSQLEDVLGGPIHMKEASLSVKFKAARVLIDHASKLDVLLVCIATGRDRLENLGVRGAALRRRLSEWLTSLLVSYRVVMVHADREICDLLEERRLSVSYDPPSFWPSDVLAWLNLRRERLRRDLRDKIRGLREVNRFIFITWPPSTS